MTTFELHHAYHCGMSAGFELIDGVGSYVSKPAELIEGKAFDAGYRLAVSGQVMTVAEAIAHENNTVAELLALDAIGVNR